MTETDWEHTHERLKQECINRDYDIAYADPGVTADIRAALARIQKFEEHELTTASLVMAYKARIRELESRPCPHCGRAPGEKAAGGDAGYDEGA